MEELTPKAQERVKAKIKDGTDTGRKCFGCGFVMEKGLELCPSCGRATVRKPRGPAQVPGQLREYIPLGKQVGDLWPHVCRFALGRHPNDHERARKFAAVQYKALTGSYPAWGRPFKPAPVCDPRVAQAVMKNYTAWKKAQRRAQSKQAKQQKEAQA